MAKDIYGARHWKKKFDALAGKLAHVGIGGVIDPVMRAEFLGKRDKLIAHRQAIIATELVRELIMRDAIHYNVEETDGELRVSGEIICVPGGLEALDGILEAPDGKNE